jgi:uncharacterized membrane protein YphA (DoxX/SURF4 family)
MIDVAILILRRFLAIVMIPHGVHKFQILDFLNKKWLNEYGFPVGSVALAGAIQIVTGLAILLGIFSSYAAIIQALVMVVGTYASIWKEHEKFLSLPTGKGWDINFLLIGAFIVLAILGDGRYALLSQ